MCFVELQEYVIKILNTIGNMYQHFITEINLSEN